MQREGGENLQWALDLGWRKCSRSVDRGQPRFVDIRVSWTTEIPGLCHSLLDGHKSRRTAIEWVDSILWRRLVVTVVETDCVPAAPHRCYSGGLQVCRWECSLMVSCDQRLDMPPPISSASIWSVVEASSKSLHTRNNFQRMGVQTKSHLAMILFCKWMRLSKAKRIPTAHVMVCIPNRISHSECAALRDGRRLTQSSSNGQHSQPIACRHYAWSSRGGAHCCIGKLHISRMQKPPPGGGPKSFLEGYAHAADSRRILLGWGASHDHDSLNAKPWKLCMRPPCELQKVPEWTDRHHALALVIPTHQSHQLWIHIDGQIGVSIVSLQRSTIASGTVTFDTTTNATRSIGNDHSE